MALAGVLPWSGPMIETNGVTISSVSVTIKALKVNNRQMTQAVFTQLPKFKDDELVDKCDEGGEQLAEYKLAGNLWGWVNYCPKGEDPELRQVIIETGGKLYRAGAPTKRIDLLSPSTHDDETKGNVVALTYQLVHVALTIVAQAIREKAESNPYIAVRKEGMTLGTFPPYGKILARQDGATVNVWNESNQGLSAKVTTKMAWHLSRCAPYQSGKPWYECEEPDEFMAEMEGSTVPQTRDWAQQTIDSTVAHVEHMNKIREVLRNTDQLFIAV
jgi:hypothetical protein